MAKSPRTGAAHGPATGSIDWSKLPFERMTLHRGDQAFAQGAPATSVFFLESGTIKLSIVSRGGKEAVVPLVQPGTFFGEGCLAGQPKRIATAVAVQRSKVLRIAVGTMRRHPGGSPASARAFPMKV